ncbi:MAG: hypothetical protein ACKVQS_03935 [Fimbriimonadaceae bacterium]
MISKLNDQLAEAITRFVATMWCAYLFAALAIWGGTALDWHDRYEVVQYISQTFLQLVLLSIIMVGHRLLSANSDAQAKEMHDGVMEELELARADRAELKAMHEDLHRVLLERG